MRPPGSTLIGTILRGLRSRALLSSASVLLIALAIGSAVMGPIFQVAATNSYLVTRLGEAPNPLTGLSWRLVPEGALAGKPLAALERAREVADRAAPDAFLSPQPVLLSDRWEEAGVGGEIQLLATDSQDGGACAHLEVEGACPQAPGEVLLLAGDAEDLELSVGDTLEWSVPGDDLTVVGTYRVPADAGDYWFDLDRFASVPLRVDLRTGAITPYRPAPLVTVPATFERFSSWSVPVDRRLAVPVDLTTDDLALAQRTAAAVVAASGGATAGAGVASDGAVRGGRLVAESSLNDLTAIAAEAREQQATARSSIGPAVLSLVLVALALLLRLLMAAADLRLPELALASLRGLSRRQLWSLGLSEPLTLLALTVPIGAGLGVGCAWALVRWWLVPGLAVPLPVTALLAGLVVVLAAVGVAVAAVGLVLRVTLAEQLTGVRRPSSSSRAALVAQVLLVATAAIVLVSKLSIRTPGDPDVTDLVLPVLLAMVAGVAATRATAALAAWWTKRRQGGSLAGYVAARAISRRREGTLVILPVTAAIAICVFGAGVYGSAAQWRASVAATAAPADVVWTSPLPMNQTVELTHRLDPDGRSLMAVSRLSTLGPTFTVADVSRLSRVASWPDQWTPGVSTDEIAERLSLTAQAPEVTGTEVAVQLTHDLTAATSTFDGRDEPSAELYLRLRLDVPGDRVHFAFLGPFANGTSTATIRAPYCRQGCELQAMSLGGPAGLPTPLAGEVRIDRISVDGVEQPEALADAGWGIAPDASAPDVVGDLRVETDGDGPTLVIPVDSDGAAVIVQLAAGNLPRALPVVRGVAARTEADQGAFSSTSAIDFPVDPVATAQSVPFLGPAGLLVDYAMLTTNRTVYEQKATVYVLARDDTPAAVSQGLRDRGLSVTTTRVEVQRALDQGAYALALRLYAVVAALVLLMALAGLLVSTAVQLPARRRDAASLRVVGVSRRIVLSAVLREYVVVLGGTAVAGLAAGTLAQYVVLRTVTLGYVEDLRTPALVAAVDGQRLVLLALVTAVLFGAVAWLECGPDRAGSPRRHPARERPLTPRGWTVAVDWAGDPRPAHRAPARPGVRVGLSAPTPVGAHRRTHRDRARRPGDRQQHRRVARARDQPPAHLLRAARGLRARSAAGGPGHELLRVEGRGPLLRSGRGRGGRDARRLDLPHADARLRAAGRRDRGDARSGRALHRGGGDRAAPAGQLLRRLDHLARGRPVQGRARHPGLVGPDGWAG